MKTKEEIHQMASALFNLEQAIPPGLEQHGWARVEGMMIALSWVLEGPLPGAYPHWFQMVLIMWKHGLTKKPKPKLKPRKRRARRVSGGFCE